MNYCNDTNGIDSSRLKIYAMVFMLIDHFGAIVFEYYMCTVADINLYLKLEQINEVLRGIGRLAFPIFCYQIVVGMRHTRNKYKYLLNLFIFFFISEIPFNLAFKNKLFDHTYQNTYLTLLLGALAVVVMEFIKDIPYAVIFQIMTGLAFSTAAYFLKSDYGFAGVTMIVAFYFFIENKAVMVYAVPAIFLLSYFAQRIARGATIREAGDKTLGEAVSAMAMILIMRDTGVRKGGKAFKWLSYAFYPLHILLFYLFRHFILKI